VSVLRWLAAWLLARLVPDDDDAWDAGYFVGDGSEWVLIIHEIHETEEHRP